MSIITTKRIREVIKALQFNPRTDKEMAIQSEEGGPQYWETQMLILLRQLNDQAKRMPETIKVEDYRRRMIYIARYAMLCIDDADQLLLENKEEGL